MADRRTSLITEPKNGRLPVVMDGIKSQETTDAESGVSDRPVRFRVGGIGMDGPEDRGLAERCLLGFNTGPPIVPGGYNQNIQLFQTPDHLVIFTEMVHDARIVPLDGRARPSSPRNSATAAPPTPSRSPRRGMAASPPALSITRRGSTAPSRRTARCPDQSAARPEPARKAASTTWRSRSSTRST